MLRNVIWTCFFTKPVCWQNSVVIFENSYLPHMTSFLAEIWSVDRYLSQEPTTIKFALIELVKLQILNFEWPKVNTGRMRDLTLKDVISMLCLFIFLDFDFQKGMDDLAFYCHWNHFVSTFRAHALHKTSTEGQICQLPSIYTFLHLSSKSAFKT